MCYGDIGRNNKKIRSISTNEWANLFKSMYTKIINRFNKNISEKSCRKLWLRCVYLLFEPRYFSRLISSNLITSLYNTSSRYLDTINQSIHQSSKRPINQSLNPYSPTKLSSIHQSINQSINQSTNQSIQ